MEIFGAGKEAVDIVEYLTLWESLTKCMVITDVGEESAYCMNMFFFTKKCEEVL